MKEDIEKAEIEIKNEFYGKCLAELTVRANWTEAFLPLLDRYVIITAMLEKLSIGIINDEITIEQTNNRGVKNMVTSPKWRMFLELNGEANSLAKELMLSPINAPKKELLGKKGFDTGMKVSKTA